MGVRTQWVRWAVAGAMLLSPAAASAQALPGTFADLPRTLKPGQSVIVMEADGRKTKGDLLDLNDSFITVRVRDRWGAEERRRVDEAGVTSIRRTDAIWNGLFIGLGAGIVATEVWTRSSCGPRGSDRECSVIVTGVGWLTMVPVGPSPVR